MDLDRERGGARLAWARPAAVAPLLLAALGAGCAGKAPAPVGLPEKPRATEAYGRGDALLREGRFDEAIRELSRAVALEPTAASPRLDLGWAFFHSGDYRKAESEFRAALVLDADRAPSHQALASALAARGAFGEAAAEFRRAWQVAGGPAEAPEAAILQALALLRAGGASPAEAARLLQGWVPALAPPWRTLARHLLGQASEEQVSGERWDEPGRALAGYAVAVGRLVRGDPAGARERLRPLAAATSGTPSGVRVVRAFAQADLKRAP